MAPRIHPRRIQRAAELRRLGHSYAEIGRIMDLRPAYVAELLKPLNQDGPFCRCCKKAIARPNPNAHYERSILCLACLGASPMPCFADRLAAHRLAAGYTLRGLAKATGIAAATLRALEQGRWDPPWRVVVALVKVLGMDLLLVPPIGPGEIVLRYHGRARVP